MNIHERQIITSWQPRDRIDEVMGGDHDIPPRDFVETALEYISLKAQHSNLVTSELKRNLEQLDSSFPENYPDPVEWGKSPHPHDRRQLSRMVEKTEET